MVYYLLFINLLTFLLFWYDKAAARRHRRRIPEKTLFFFSVMGGAPGGWLAMLLFRHKTRHWYFKLFMPLLSVAVLCVGGFLAYTEDYYRADETVRAVAVQREGRLTTLSPNNSNGTGVIFYPGAKVEADAYLPLLDQLRTRGYTCVLVEMPFRLAFFDVAAADDAMAAHPEIDRWILAGHSLGGAMAGSYAGEHPDAIDALVLLGAYPYGDYPGEKTLVLYGSEDGVLNRAKLTDDAHELVLPGGNHAGFGAYGPQAGDGDALITPAEQQTQTVDAIVQFIG